MKDITCLFARNKKKLSVRGFGWTAIYLSEEEARSAKLSPGSPNEEWR